MTIEKTAILFYSAKKAFCKGDITISEYQKILQTIENDINKLDAHFLEGNIYDLIIKNKP